MLWHFARLAHPGGPHGPPSIQIVFFDFFTFRIQNPNTPWSSLVGAAHGWAAGRSGARQTGMPTGRLAQKPPVLRAFPGIVNNCPERIFR